MMSTAMISDIVILLQGCYCSEFGRSDFNIVDVTKNMTLHGNEEDDDDCRLADIADECATSFESSS